MTHEDPRPQRQTFLPFSPPDITDEEIASVTETLRSNWITTGPKTRAFEVKFEAYVGAKSALALSSCTAGLHLALLSLDIGPGDEVITTPMTFCSSVNVIEHVQATPVLVDIERETMTLDVEQVASAITPNTRAILVVHYAGHPADMHSLQELADAHDLAIVEDAAHALPSSYEGNRVGSTQHLTAFSFYATKNLTTGEGGMLTGTPEMVERARILSLHGMSRDAWTRYDAEGSWYYEVVTPGFKYNMTDIQAALGLVQLSRLDDMQACRREIVKQYNSAFSEVEALQVPIELPNVEHAWHLYVLRLNLDQLTIDRAQFIDALAARNIGTSVHFVPVHLHPFYRDKYGWEPDAFPTAYGEYQRLMSLPLNPGLSDEDVADVIDAVSEVVTQSQR